MPLPEVVRFTGSAGHRLDPRSPRGKIRQHNARFVADRTRRREPRSVSSCSVREVCLAVGVGAVASATWYEITSDTAESFDLQRGRLVDTSHLGEFLLHGLADTELLAEISKRHGLMQVEQYLRTRRISPKLNIRVGDFGEVTAGRILEDEESLLRPIEKLRYVFNKDWSPHLTDVFAVQIAADEITAFAYCEVKAGTTRPKPTVPADGYRDLLKAWRDNAPAILHFTAERLFEAQRYDDYDRLDRALARGTAMPQLLRLVLVYDEGVWSDDLLDDLRSAISADNAAGSAFRCYLVTQAEFRGLVDAAYDRLIELVGGS